MTVPHPPVDVDGVIDLLASLGSVPSEGGGYSELDHALQCAAELRSRVPDDVELQVAGLVHDVGHVFGDDGSHGRAGRAAVTAVLGDLVGWLVEAHVPAKRYLVSTDRTYRHSLSDGSRETLVAQGGELSTAEVDELAADPRWATALVLRHADDAAKVPGRVVPGLDHWVPALREVAARAGRGR